MWLMSNINLFPIDLDAGNLGSKCQDGWVEALTQVANFSLYPPMAERARSSLRLLYKGINLIHEGFDFMIYPPTEAPLTNAIILRTGIQRTDLEGTQHSNWHYIHTKIPIPYSEIVNFFPFLEHEINQVIFSTI